jgi:hypothetical protein
MVNKNVFDLKHVKSVSAIVLLKEGKPAGKIICNWSDNPAGSVCTAQVLLYDGVISARIKEKHVKTEFLDCKLPVSMIGKAGGYGYDKRSSAIDSALRAGGIHDLLPVQGGSGNERQVFEAAGFTWIDVI